MAKSAYEEIDEEDKRRTPNWSNIASIINLLFEYY